jgi:hypothetical protein
MTLTPFEADTLLGMLGDIDPAHFESYPPAEGTRRQAAFLRAREKLEVLAAKRKGST